VRQEGLSMKNSHYTIGIETATFRLVAQVALGTVTEIAPSYGFIVPSVVTSSLAQQLIIYSAFGKSLCTQVTICGFGC
jgi:hypothetical protein